MIPELWIAEKRGVAQKIAAALGVRQVTSSYIETSTGAVIAWCEGHLLRLGNPEDYNAAWKSWDDPDALPMIPERWDTFDHELERRRSLLKGLGGLLKQAACVVIATDAGREGETIAREVLVHFRYRGEVKRFWGKAESPAGIRQAIGQLRPGVDTIRLYYAGKARAIADWLVGLNATRLATHQARTALGGRGPLLSVGRVQSPTLALMVRRDRAIETFEPRPYWDVSVDVHAHAGAFRMKLISEDRLSDQLVAEQTAASLRDAALTLAVSTVRKRTPPPPLFSLALLQQVSNKRFKWSLKRTQETAQTLKDKGFITYHRTDSVHLEDGQIADVPDLVRVIGHLPSLATAAKQLIDPVIRKSVFDSSKVSDHAAITPTLDPPDSVLSPDEAALYQLICARTLAGLSADYVYDATKIEARHADHLLRAVGHTPVELGWRGVLQDEPAVEEKAVGDRDQDEQPQRLPMIDNGAQGNVTRTLVDRKLTKPEARYTEGSLSADMIGIAKYATDPEIRKRLRATSGIGRPSTHDKIIETLVSRDYVERQGVQIISTALGRALVDALLPELVEPTLTALWEDQLLDIENGKGDPRLFIDNLKTYLPQLMERMRRAPLAITAADVLQSASKPSRTSARHSPPSGNDHRPAKRPAKRAGATNSANSRAAASRVPPTRVDTTADAGPRPSRFAPRAGQPSRPSDRALAYATELSRESGVPLPERARDDSSECSLFINTMKAGRPPARQLERALTLARQKGIAVPSRALERADECSSFIKAQLGRPS